MGPWDVGELKNLSNPLGNYTSPSLSKISLLLPYLSADIFPPYLVCPGDVMKDLPESATSVLVTWDPPEVSDLSGEDVIVSVSHQPGSNFTSGVTWVTYTARDQTGNEISCEFQVTIEGRYI